MTMIGIDLGTTNTLAAVYKDGAVVLIPNAYHSYLTPSVVACDENGNILTGLPAKKYQLEHPERAASLFKRKMGSKEKIQLGKKKFLPEELSAFIIRSVVEDAQRFLDDRITEAVISVPAYFYDEQRAATKKAGILAGLKTERIINEPSAAALAAYYAQGKEQLAVVFDFGGGTLDVSVIDCIGAVVNIVSIAGDSHLGGSDFDRVIAESFLAEHHLTSLDETEKNALLLAAERCKMRLSTEKETDLVFTLDGSRLVSHYTRNRLAAESEEMLMRMRSVIIRALRDAELEPSQVEMVIAAGGSAHMPLVQSYLRYLFRKKPYVPDNCDSIIAEGVGLFCGIRERKPGVREYILSDICPFSLGESTYNEALPSRDYCTVLIPRNSILPCSVERKFYTIRDKQTKIDLNVLQGESIYADENRVLDRFSVKIPSAPKGKEAIKVRYTYDINGILLVDVEVISTGEKISRVLAENVSEEELAANMRKLEELKVHPRDRQENRELMARLQSLCAEATGSKRDWLANVLSYFEKTLEEQNVYHIQKAAAKIQEILRQEETDEMFEDAQGFLDTLEEEEEEDEPEEWEVFNKWIS